MNRNQARVLFSLLFTFTILLSAYNIRMLARQVTDQNVYQTTAEGVKFTQIDAGGVSEEAGLQVDDLLLAINGDSVSTAQQAQGYLNRALPGGSLVYTIQRGDEVFDVTVELALAGLRVFQISLIITAIFLYLLSGLIIYRSGEQRYARLMALALMMLGFLFANSTLANILNSVPVYGYLFLLVFIANLYFMPVVLHHATLYFPTRKYTHFNKFWIIKLPYILAGILVLTVGITNVMNGVLPLMLIGIILLYVMASAVIMYKKKLPEYKRQNRFTFYGVFALFLLGIFLALFLDSLGKGFAEYATFTMMLFPFLYFYTIVRYRIFNISMRVRKSILYFATQLALTVGFIAALLLVVNILPLLHLKAPAIFFTGTTVEVRSLGRLAPEIQDRIEGQYLLLLGIVATLGLLFILRRVRRIIDRLFFQQKHDYRQAIRNVTSLLSGVTSREELVHSSVEQVPGLMQVKGAALAFPHNDGWRIRYGVGELSEGTVSEIQLAGETRNLLLRGQVQPLNESHFSNPSDAEHIACAVAVQTDKSALPALLLISEKRSESSINADDLELLQLYSENLATAFERIALFGDVEEGARLKRELEIAREIQYALLPGCTPQSNSLSICATLSPAMEVGGDYYDYIENDPRRLGVIIGDVVGKGTSAALYISKIQGYIQTLTRQKLPTHIMLQQLNELIKDAFPADFFFTAIYGEFVPEDHLFRLFRLGHNGLFYYNSTSGEVILLEPSGIAFGLVGEKKFNHNMQRLELNYRAGDVFVFVTDGVLEALNAASEEFGEERLRELIAAGSELPATDLLEKIQAQVAGWRGERPRNDDETIVIVRITA